MKRCTPRIQVLSISLFLLTLEVLSHPLPANHDIEFCYNPTELNVSYDSVFTLATTPANATIAYGSDKLQFGELWLPSSTQAAPLVVFVHGGCWLNEYDFKHTRGLATALARSGYAVWSLEYRRTGDQGGGWPGTFNDIELALSKLNLLSNYQIDLTNIALVGHSAGGHLALLYASLPNTKIPIKAVIGLAPIIDIAQYSQGKNSCEVATPLFMSGTPIERPSEYAAATVAAKRLHIPSLIIHGSADSIVDPSQAKAASDVEVRLIEGAGHFDMVHPNTQAFSELLKALGKYL